MNSIIFVSGIPGAGKSTFIWKRYFDRDKYYILDMAAESMRRFGDLEPLKDEDYGEKRLSIINKMVDKGIFALFDGKDLVVEYNIIGEEQDEFLDLLQKANQLGFRTELISLAVELEEAERRKKLAGEAYFFSEELVSDMWMVLENILENYHLNIQLEEIASFKWQTVKVQLFKKQAGEECVYFFLEEGEHYLGFKSIEDYQNEELGDHMLLYPNCGDALHAMMSRYGFENFFLLSMSEEFKPVLEQYLSKQKDISLWKLFLN